MRTEQVLEIADGIRVSMVTHQAPLPDGFPDHPRACDELLHLRVKLVDGPDDPAHADTVIALLPGAIAGARSLQPLGRNTVRNLHAAGITAEVWVLDRRANGVEDHSAIEVAMAEGDYRLAFDYYYGGREVGGRRFAGFRSDRELGFLAEFGMARTIEDAQLVLSREIPDPDVRAQKVFFGGHSLGGIQAGTYAAWDLGGRPGHEQIAGLIALDTITHMDPLRLESRSPVIGKAARAVGSGIERSAAAMRRGLLPRSTAIMKGGWGNAEAFILVAAIATAATLAPDAETDILRLLPEKGTPQRALRGSTARTWREFLTGTPDYRKLRLTNQALLGLIGGSHTSMNLAILSMSCGTLDSAAVAPRTFPLPFEASTVPGLKPLYQAVFGTQPRSSPTSFDELYRWRDYDRCGTHDAPTQPSRRGVPASTTGEVVSIVELAKMLAGGRLNVFEDYFPTRQSSDAVAVLSGCRSGSLAPVRHQSGAARLPYINLMGASSFTNVLTGWGVYPENTHWFRGYLHCDVAAGADPRADGTPEPIAATLAEFVRANLPSVSLAS